MHLILTVAGVLAVGVGFVTQSVFNMWMTVLAGVLVASIVYHFFKYVLMILKCMY